MFLKVFDEKEKRYILNSNDVSVMYIEIDDFLNIYQIKSLEELSWLKQ